MISLLTTLTVLVPAGIFDTLLDQSNQFMVVVKNLGALGITVVLLWQVIKRGFAIGAIIGVLLGAGLAFFLLNGGAQWIGEQFSQQLGA